MKPEQNAGSGENTLDKALSEALRPEAVKVSAKLHMVRAGATLGPWSPETMVVHLWAS